MAKTKYLQVFSDDMFVDHSACLNIHNQSIQYAY